MSVPVDVPPVAPTARGRKRSSRKVNGGSVPHLTRDGDGWRFQMRVPAALTEDFRLAGRANIVRRTLGPRGRGEAKRLARQLATLCESIFALAAAQKDANTMTTMTPQEKDLAQQVIAACQAAIGRAIAQPSQAIGLAHGLGAALTSLQLVQSEVAKGEAGARAVVDHADALTDVLKMSAQPAEALAALAAVPTVAPPAPPPARVPSAPPSAPSAGGPLPTFGEISQRYIDMRIRNNAKDSEIQRLRFARRSFIEFCGDRPIDLYFPSDLQDYVSAIQYWPANAAKRKEMEGLSVRDILDSNKTFTLKPLARNTLQNGYVAAIRTETRSGMADHRYRDPFSGADIRWPDMLAAPVPREGIGVDVINRVFRDGVSSGLLDEAMLPPLAKLSSRRIGLLTHLRGSDIREKYGVMVAQARRMAAFCFVGYFVSAQVG